MIRTGIIGIGNIGSAHAAALRDGLVDGMELTAVCDISESRRAWAEENLPGVRIFAAAEEFFAESGVEAVIIAVPHFLHTELAEEAFRHGIDVLSEKPLAVSLTDAQRAVQAAKAAGRVYCIMWNQRTSSLYNRVRELLADGSIGRPDRLLWETTSWYRPQVYYNSSTWRATWRGEGGGVLMNQAPHQLDLMQWIFGMPDAVYADLQNGRYHEIEVEDDATLLCSYDDGRRAVFITSTGEKEGCNRLEITGSEGILVAEPGRIEISRKNAETGKTETKRFEIGESGTGHVNVLNAFSAFLRNKTAPVAFAEDGLNELKLANAAYLSSWTGQKVRFPLDQETYDRLLAEKQKNSVPHERVAEEGWETGFYRHKWGVY